MTNFVTDPSLSLGDFESVATHEIGVGDLTLYRLDGTEIDVLDVLVDSVGPSGASNSVIAVEFPYSDTVMHFANISHWTFSYRF